MFSFLKKNKGQTFTEYALILVFVGLIVAIGSIQLFDASQENYKQGLIPTRTAEMEGLPPVPEGFYDSGNQRPVAVIQGPTIVHRGDWVTYTNASYDPDGTIKMVSWGGYAASQSGNTIRLQFPNDGTYQIKLTVVDDKGLASSTVIEVQVGNQKPIAKITLSPGNNVYYKQNLVISSNGTKDPDNDPITEWVWKVDGVVQNWPLSGSTVQLPPGTHTISLIVKDHWDEWSAEVTQVVYVDPSTIPNAVITINPTSNISYRQMVSISGKDSYDIGGSSITQCIWTLDGVQQSWNCNGINSQFSPGTHTVTLKVKNQAGVWSDVVSKQFSVLANRKPTVVSITVNPSSNIHNLTDLTFSITTSDPDGDKIVQQEWRVDNGTVTSNYPKNLPPGTHTVYVRVKDEGGLWSDWKSITLNVATHVDTTFTFKGQYETFVVPITGKYKIELWGAQGGQIRGSSSSGGLGGYVSGEIQLQQNQVLYFFVGGKPEDVDNRIDGGCSTLYSYNYGGWNGGGNGRGSRGPGGGGATDVRLGGTSLNNRILVAGGGGGGFINGVYNHGGHDQSSYLNGTYGTGSSGYCSSWYYSNGNYYPSDHAGGGGGYIGGATASGDDPSTGYGGSNYIGSQFTNTKSQAGVNIGHGHARIVRVQ